VQNLQIKVNKELDEISNWMSVNKLTVNLQKSHALIINPYKYIHLSINLQKS